MSIGSPNSLWTFALTIFCKCKCTCDNLSRISSPLSYYISPQASFSIIRSRLYAGNKWWRVVIMASHLRDRARIWLYIVLLRNKAILVVSATSHAWKSICVKTRKLNHEQIQPKWQLPSAWRTERGLFIFLLILHFIFNSHLRDIPGKIIFL